MGDELHNGVAEEKSGEAWKEKSDLDRKTVPEVEIPSIYADANVSEIENVEFDVAIFYNHF